MCTCTGVVCGWPNVHLTESAIHLRDALMFSSVLLTHEVGVRVAISLRRRRVAASPI